MPFCVSVGVEGVDPLSVVHPEKALVVGLMLLYQSVDPSDPLTTT